MTTLQEATEVRKPFSAVGCKVALRTLAASSIPAWPPFGPEEQHTDLSLPAFQHCQSHEALAVGSWRLS